MGGDWADVDMAACLGSVYSHYCLVEILGATQHHHAGLKGARRTLVVA